MFLPAFCHVYTGHAGEVQFPALGEISDSPDIIYSNRSPGIISADKCCYRVLVVVNADAIPLKMLQENHLMDDKRKRHYNKQGKDQPVGTEGSFRNRQFAVLPDQEESGKQGYDDRIHNIAGPGVKQERHGQEIAALDKADNPKNNDWKQGDTGQFQRLTPAIDRDKEVAGKSDEQDVFIPGGYRQCPIDKDTSWQD